MGSPSTSSLILESSSDDDYSDRELEAMSLAAGAVAMYVAQNPPNPIQRRKAVYRDLFEANERLMKDYFHPTEPTYDDKAFRRRFRMSKRLFLRIANDLEAHFDYFKQKPDVVGNPGFTSIQKCTAAMRVIGYGVPTDLNDDYLKMAEKMCRNTVEKFTIGIKALYEKRYLRKPTKNDLMRIYDVHREVHGIPGMMGSIDCMHWAWSNCPTAWRGQYHGGSHKGPTLVLQAVCSYDLWVWSAYFGIPGSHNDINILEQSPVLEDIISGKSRRTVKFPVIESWKGQQFIHSNFPVVPVSDYSDIKVLEISEILNGVSIVDVKMKGYDDIFVVLSSAKDVVEFKPQINKIKEAPGRGIIITALAPEGSGFDFYSRFFCPKYGIDEDPVCGSAHCTLAAYWHEKLGRCDFVAYQFHPTPPAGDLNILKR